MSLKKKLAMAVVSTTAGAVIMAAGSFAYFTSTATNASNTFSTGTVVLGLAPASTAFNATNMYPGASNLGHLQVQNNGTLPFKYEVQATGITNTHAGNVDTATPISDQLQVAIYDGNLTDVTGVTPLWSTSLNTLASAAIPVPETLAAASNRDFTFKVTLPTTAGNDYQNDSATGSITFIATQVDNPGWAE